MSVEILNGTSQITLSIARPSIFTNNVAKLSGFVLSAFAKSATKLSIGRQSMPSKQINRSSIIHLEEL